MMAGQGLFFRSLNFISNGRSLLKNRIANINAQFAFLGIKQDFRAKVAELKIPEKPKKPLTPYFRFVRDHRKNILKDNPNVKPTDLIKKCAEDWRKVSTELKIKYTDDYNLEHEKYEMQFIKYQGSLSPEQKNAIQDLEDLKKEDKKKRKLRKLYKETKKPKRPMGAYMHYVVDQSKLRNEPLIHLMAQLKDEWSKLTAQERGKYENIFLKEKQNYEVAMREWEARMIAEGKDELIEGKLVDQKIPSRGHECLHSKSSVNTGEGTLFHNETKEYNSTKVVHPVLQDINKKTKITHQKNISYSSNSAVNSFVSKNEVLVTDNKDENLMTPHTKISDVNQQSKTTQYKDKNSDEALDNLEQSASSGIPKDSINLPLQSEKSTEGERERNTITNKLRKFFKF